MREACGRAGPAKKLGLATEKEQPADAAEGEGGDVWLNPHFPLIFLSIQGPPPVDPEERRRRQAEAAAKRQAAVSAWSAGEKRKDAAGAFSKYLSLSLSLYTHTPLSP